MNPPDDRQREACGTPLCCERQRTESVDDAVPDSSFNPDLGAFKRPILDLDLPVGLVTQKQVEQTRLPATSVEFERTSRRW